MNQQLKVLQVMYRTRKGGLAMLEKELAGQTLHPQVEAVLEQERAVVADLEKRLKKG